MTSKPSTDGLTFTLDCDGQPVRVFMWEGVPWFEADAICTAMRVHSDAVRQFDRNALDTDIALYSFDDEPVPVLSPIGVWKMGNDQDPYATAKVAAWAKREAGKLVSGAAPDDPRVCVTLTPDGLLPPTPTKYSGRLAEWKTLRHSDLGIAAYVRGRSIVRQAALRMPNPL